MKGNKDMNGNKSNGNKSVFGHLTPVGNTRAHYAVLHPSISCLKITRLLYIKKCDIIDLKSWGSTFSSAQTVQNILLKHF